MKNEKVGDIEAEKQRDRPDDYREFQRAAIEPQRRRACQQLAIIVEHEGRIESGAVVIKEADDKEQRRRQQEEHQQDQRQRNDLQRGHCARGPFDRQRLGLRRLRRKQRHRVQRSCPAAHERAVDVRRVRRPPHCRLPAPLQRADSEHHAALFTRLRLRICGRIRVPNCSMPMTKSSKVIITPRTPGTADISSSMRATEA